ncbi:MAG: hypothetical protein H7836_08040 [Magnetococcus sp. YQC-3]
MEVNSKGKKFISKRINELLKTGLNVISKKTKYSRLINFKNQKIYCFESKIENSNRNIISFVALTGDMLNVLASYDDKLINKKMLHNSDIFEALFAYHIGSMSMYSDAMEKEKSNESTTLH